MLPCRPSSCWYGASAAKPFLPKPCCRSRCCPATRSSEIYIPSHIQETPRWRDKERKMVRTQGSQFVKGLLIAGGMLTWGSAQGVQATDGKPTVVKIVEENGAFHLMRNGVPFLIKGGGGDGARKL